MTLSPVTALCTYACNVVPVGVGSLPRYACPGILANGLGRGMATAPIRALMMPVDRPCYPCMRNSITSEPAVEGSTLGAFSGSAACGGHAAELLRFPHPRYARAGNAFVVAIALPLRSTALNIHIGRPDEARVYGPPR